MRKRAGGAAAKPQIASPLLASGGRSSKRSSKFDFTMLASSVRKTAATSASPLRHPAAAASPPPQRTVTTISDLKELASSRIDAMKGSLDHSHSEILKDLEASNTRLCKRLKLQTQACVQLSEEVEKDYKKLSERITENTDLMKASYTELISEAQAAASRVCKVTIPELAQSLEKAIDGLRSRYKLPST